MDMKVIIAAMYPYWIAGAMMVLATIVAGRKDVVRIEKKAVLSWIRFLCFVTLYRIFLFKMFPHVFSGPAKAISIIPWPMTLTVFWEDACHGLPLYILRLILGTKKWTWPIHGLLMLAMMLEFGMGHMYQGIYAACALSLYIPYSISLGKKYGFGTVMLGHTLYDLTTVLSIKLLSG